MKQSPIQSLHTKLGAQMGNVEGWYMPQFYTNPEDEHVALHRACGIFDLSYLAKFSVRGKGALPWLLSIFSESIEKLTDGHNRQTLLLNQQDTIIDKLVLARVHQELFFLIGSAAQEDIDDAYLKSRLPLNGVSFSNDTALWCALSLVGPDSAAVFHRLFPQIPYPDFGSFVRMKHGSDFIYLSRSGIEDAYGLDIYCPANKGVDWFEQWIAAGAVPCGMASRMRLNKK